MSKKFGYDRYGVPAQNRDENNGASDIAKRAR
jgi:hypothetical protein